MGEGVDKIISYAQEDRRVRSGELIVRSTLTVFVDVQGVKRGQIQRVAVKFFLLEPTFFF